MTGDRENSNDWFAEAVMTDFADRLGEFEPAAFYDPDGDCIEFLASPEPYKRHRLDKWVTVYQGRDSNDIVGSLIKNVRELLKKYPGLDIEVRGGRVYLAHIFRAPAWSEGDPVKRSTYRALIAKLDSLNLTADLHEAGAA